MSTIITKKLAEKGALVTSMRTARQLLQAYLDAISAGEMEKAIALFAEDGALEFPYFGSVNLPTRFQGPDAIRQLLVPVMEGAENFQFKNVKIFPGEDENHVSGEYEVDAVIKKTGRPYQQLYGGRLVAENGRIKLLREFCDTVEVARAMLGARQNSSLCREPQAIITGGVSVEPCFPELMEPTAGLDTAQCQNVFRPRLAPEHA